MNELIYALIAIIPGLLLVFMVVVFGDADGSGDNLEIGDGGWEGPSPFNGKLVLGFFCGFGLGGLLCLHYEWTSAHWLIALAGGAIVYGIVFLMLVVLYSQRSNSQPRADTLVGTMATVKTRIPKGGAGEVSVTDRDTGSTMFMRAVGPDTPVGVRVKIVDVSAGTATVEYLKEATK